MRIGNVHSFKKVLAQILLLGVPTVALAYYFLYTANNYYNVLQNHWLLQGITFSVGCFVAIMFYSKRFRFFTTVAALLLLLWLVYYVLNRVVVGEFDTALMAINFKIHATLFFIGWLAGWGFSRSRYFTVFWSVGLLALQILIVSRITDVKAATIILLFAPTLVYAFYMIYTAELIRNMNEDEKGFGWFITKRIAGFIAVTGIILLVMFTAFNQEFKAIEKEWGQAEGKQKKEGNKESLTQENKDGTIKQKKDMRVTGSFGRGKKNRLVFVAKLDNYFPNSNIPNPLYFTNDYFTKFDTLTQTFETDSLMPLNDLFKPDPSQIPLYFAKTDSSIIQKSGGELKRKVVNAEVYSVNLSPTEYMAPSNGFFCQPISVEPTFKNQYRSAYRTKMWVSELNSAYFVYNPAGNFQLEAFQQERFNELRNVATYDSVDKKFMEYYTFMPGNEEYKRIKDLALEVTKNATTPVDKVIALRDYFLGKDEYGQPLFKYSDNPGIPGLPSASKLNYFLFENRKGYCAYYAGATLFMLRGLGIPSRIATGFLTVDRSSKNPGWYWFYEDQAHAWVQVYFPRYGWIDFDTTVPDEEAQQSPQPDQTPPLNMQQAYFVANGKVASIDTVKKMMDLQVEKILYHDKALNPEANKTITLNMDVSIATVTGDTGLVGLSDIKKGMEVVAVSYAEAIKNVPPTPEDNFNTIIGKLPKPVPIDEVKIMEPKQEEASAKEKSEEFTPFSWLQIFWISLAVIVGLIALLFAMPSLIWAYLNGKAKRKEEARRKAYHINRAIMYYLNQLGYARTNKGPFDYAREIDQKFGTRLQNFINVYQKLKYSTQPLTENEMNLISSFYQPFISSVKKQVPAKTRTSKFLNIYNTIHFFTQPKTNQ